MKLFSILVGATSLALQVDAQQVSFKEVRTASPTVLVAFFKDAHWTGPVYDRSYSISEVVTTNLSAWTLNGKPVTAIDKFVTEANAVDYHIYLHVPALVNGKSYTLVTPYGSTNFVFDDKRIFCESIKVNQSGYSALSKVRYAKLGIWLGTGGAQPITGTLPTYTVFKQNSGEEIASGRLEPCGSGRDVSSGDYVYQMDLSSVPEGGPYKVSVKGYGCSYPFGVGGNFSRRLGYVAFRALYYNRCGCPVVKPYAWADIRPDPCHTNVYDSQASNSPDVLPARAVTTNQPKLKVYGGYHDAGDADRRGYHLMVPPVLLTTYEAFPDVFTDDQFNIPDKFDEAFRILGKGNGIPDILDEAWWGTMLWTNLQSTPRGPAGAVAWGVNASGYPNWGISYNEDTLLWGTQTNNVDSCGLAAGLFLHMARLIEPYDPKLTANLQDRAEAAYNYLNSVPGWKMKTTHKLYYAIQKYLITGDAAADQIIHSLYTCASGFTNTFNQQAGAFLPDENAWLASYFTSYVLATNRPTDRAIVAYFKTQLKTAADIQIGYLSATAYPVGMPADFDLRRHGWTQGYCTSQGEYSYPCLLQWRLTGEQKYIDTVSQLMDYDQGLNPMGKCFMTGLGFEQVHNPEHQESAYAQWVKGWGGPLPGITVYGPGPIKSGPHLIQIPAVTELPRERKWIDDAGAYPWNEFTVEENEMFPAVIYPVLSRGGKWDPARNPFDVEK